MKVYAVLAYDNYYPGPDNCRGLFRSFEDAQAFLVEHKATSRYTYDYYDIVEKEVN